MAANGNGLRLSHIPWAAVGVIVALLAQAGGIVIWATSEHNSRIALQDRFQARVDDVNKKLSSIIPPELIEQRLRVIEEANRNQDLQLRQLQDLSQQLAVVRDRQERSIDALNQINDNVRNLIQKR